MGYSLSVVAVSSFYIAWYLQVEMENSVADCRIILTFFGFWDAPFYRGLDKTGDLRCTFNLAISKLFWTCIWLEVVSEAFVIPRRYGGDWNCSTMIWRIWLCDAGFFALIDVSLYEPKPQRSFRSTQIIGIIRHDPSVWYNDTNVPECLILRGRILSYLCTSCFFVLFSTQYMAAGHVA